ncbi:MAG TPA: GlsB/YeaQ/YmgE family stress response membrane protein [Mycobacteriales bacterium]|nr:GlsB/YeaQ/YmgE family stress response membrane protein [Mycobacteriales bacterium]
MTVGGWVSAVLVGIVIGYLGRVIAPKSRGGAQLGLLLTILIGIVAAVVGTAVANAADVHRFILVFPIQLVAAALFVTAFRRLPVR